MNEKFSLHLMGVDKNGMVLVLEGAAWGLPVQALQVQGD